MSILNRIFNIFKARKAIFKWETNLATGICKVAFKGSFNQIQSRSFAITQFKEYMEEGERLISFDFHGLE